MGDRPEICAGAQVRDGGGLAWRRQRDSDVLRPQPTGLANELDVGVSTKGNSKSSVRETGRLVVLTEKMVCGKGRN